MVEDDELYIPKFTSEVGEGISTTDKVLRREITKMSEHINRLTYRVNQLEKEITDMKIDAL
jgi:cell division protein FtsB